MARILFIIPDCRGRYGKPATPHVGIAYLAAAARAKGHEPYVIDRRVELRGAGEIEAEIARLKPDFIGVTSVSYGYQLVYDFINSLKPFGIPVIYGGPHVSTMREEVFKGCEPFAAVCGEGEETLCELLEGRPRGHISGIIYRDESGAIVSTPPRASITDLDSLPFPAYELFRLGLYAERKIPLATSRDCPFECTYCGVKLVMGRGFRKRSAENVLAEIEKWCREGYAFFGINDDTFTTDIARVERICDLIIERGLKIGWELRTGVRVDRVNEQMLRRMKAAGCEFLAFGIESINDNILLNIKKGITFAQVDRAIALAAKVGIPFSGFFIIGLPGDSLANFMELLSFTRNRPFEEVWFYNLEPYPRTEVFDWVMAHGTMFKPPEEYLNESSRLNCEPLFETPDFSAAERRGAYKLGETLMVEMLVKKTVGQAAGALLAPLLAVDLIRGWALTLGFAFPPLFRKMQALRRSMLPGRRGRELV